MFSKILIANRGEIALRIIRACKELGIRSVAVYSQADKECMHVKMADEAICIGGPVSNTSYLNIPSIISAAEVADVDAIHPGYGFLAENVHFAEICQSSQITFIGPKPENIRQMGDKMQAKILMKKAGVPVIPGSDNIITDKDEALKIAKEIGYPVIIKAVAGGGGRGMRICHNDIRLVSAFMTASSEAESAFGNSGVYIEKYFEKSKHIEVQLLADKFGNIVHLGERDCTIQRRHQKLIEESPSPAIDDKMRKLMGEMAVEGAKKVGYENAGTIEFLVDRDKRFYFMEMNTRVQVEHPVTEMVCGVDIVKEQIKIAAEERLSFSQDDIKIEGWAIECRINAEDPYKNFIPQAGKIESYFAPGGLGVRIDSHIYAGYSIPPYYDSLLAKLVVYNKTRENAIITMRRVLDEYQIGPIKTTVPLHKEIFHDNIFVEGDFYTDFVDNMMEHK